jgi:hypothetical protein
MSLAILAPIGVFLFILIATSVLGRIGIEVLEKRGKR